MREYWDRYIRDDNHLRATVDYIHRNSVKSCLCQNPGDWPWSSARRADVLVGLANGETNDQATGDTSLAPHSHANEDVGVPGKDAGAT